MTVIEIIDQISNTPGSKDKMTILEQNMSPLLKQIFNDTYDTSRNYYIKKFIEPSGAGEMTIEDNYQVFHNMLDALNKRVVIGNAAIEFVSNTIALYSLKDQDVLYRILDRNLKIGISRDNFNKISGGAIDKFTVALAKKLDEVKGVDILDGTWYVSRKLDGCRCIIICENTTDAAGELTQTIEFKSRQGKTFTTLSNLIPDVKLLFSPYENGKWVLDGELCIVDENGDEHFDWVMKEITRKNHTIQNPCYKAFDLLSWEEFTESIPSRPFSERYETLWNHCNFAKPYMINVVEQELIKNQEVLDKWQDRVIKGNWEGLMVRKGDSVYEGKRTKNLLKIKAMQDAEYIVEDVIMGKVTYNEGGSKEYDAASALVIRHRGSEVKVGSGLSKEQRLRWFDHPEEIIGKTVTIQYFEETMDSKTGEPSLRFPVLKYIYEDGRNI